jgi:hypothetical protein
LKTQDIFDEVFPVVHAAAMFTASQFQRPEFKWFSERHRFHRCGGYAFAALAEPVSISIANELSSSASMRHRIETVRRLLLSRCSCANERPEKVAAREQG